MVRRTVHQFAARNMRYASFAGAYPVSKEARCAPSMTRKAWCEQRRATIRRVLASVPFDRRRR
jgi:hypothetical protein